MRTLTAPGVALVAAAIGLALGSSSPAAQRGSPRSSNESLTAVPGIRVGHHTLDERPTGCTVILADDGAVGGVAQRGGAPGTRETDLLDPLNLVDRVNAVVLSGGSAFGLDAAGGVMRFLDEREIGWPTPSGRVPIVTGAILFDLGVGSNPKVRPTADCGYRAAGNASASPVREGSVGAGAGATIGKFGGAGRPMKGGIGTAAAVMPGGLIVSALVAANAAGDIIDPDTGQVVAGVRTAGGQLADLRRIIRSGQMLQPPRPGEHTTIGVVATNARLTKAQANRLALMADDGLARAIFPSHTEGDGDTLFALATGQWTGNASISTIGAIAADVVARAVVRAATEATSVAGIPAVRDLK
jgi:L-aminopeptidase/D-esterase-like protein